MIRRWLAACAAVIAACNGSSEGAPPGPPSFAAEPTPETGAPLVFLRGRAEGQRVVVDVVARGVPEIHGTAFRLTWAPEVLSFVTAEPAPAWSNNAVLLAKEPAPGQLTVAWTEKGDARGLDATSPVVLGTLVFDAKGRKGTALSFRVDRSTVRDRHGKDVSVGWRAGSVPAR